MRRLLLAVPVLLSLVLAMLFFRDLNGSAPIVPSLPLVGEPAPAIDLPPLDGAAKKFGSSDLRTGHVTVVNVWASWCTPCRAEAPSLAAIARAKTANVYGIDYEDKPAAAREFLDQTGDPFARLDIDANGHARRAWGIYGLPETFIIDGKGIVRLRFAGPIVADALARTITPAIASARKN